MIYVATMSYDRAKDLAVADDRVPAGGNPPVYLIVMRGGFTAGTYLSAIYDAMDLRSYEAGVTNTEPLPVGPVTCLQTP